MAAPEPCGGATMKIVYLHQYYNTPAEPGSTRSYEFARRMAAMGHDVHMVTTAFRPGPPGPVWSVAVEQGVTVHRLTAVYRQAMSNQQRLKVFTRFAVHATLRSLLLRPDVVFASSTPLTVAIPALLSKWVLRRPMVFEVRDAWPELPIALGALGNPLLRAAALALEWAAYHGSSRVVALSEGMKDSVTRTGYPAERVLVVPNACDVDQMQATTVDAHRWLDQHLDLRDKTLIVYAGSIGRIHGTLWLAELASELLQAHPEVVLVVTGDGSEKEDLLAMGSDLGVLGHNLFVLPAMPKAAIPDLLRAATAGISTTIALPELEANSANKFFDYLAAGIPVFINYGGWQQGVLEGARAGSRLDRDPKAAAVQLIDFLASESSVRNARQAAIALARSRYSRDELSSVVIALLEKVHAEARRRPRRFPGRHR